MRLLAEDATAPGRRAHRGAIQIFPQVHQSQKSAQHARFQIIRKVQTTRRYARQSLAVFGDKSHNFLLPFVRRISQRGFAPHFRAARFQ